MTEETPIETAIPAATRRWIYSIAIAVAPVLAAVGIANDGIIQNVLVVIAAVLSVSTDSIARKNAS